MDWNLFMDVAGAVLGITYVILEYRASIWLWAVSVIMPIVHGLLYYNKGLYADFGMEFYYVAAAIYGYVCWRWGNKDKESKDVPITHYKRSHILPSIIVGVALWASLYWFLTTWTDSRVPLLDSFTTALSAVALWALAKKYVEQWLLWFVVDAVCFGLYLYKGIPFTASLYGFYTVMAVLGYLKWKKMATSNA